MEAPFAGESFRFVIDSDGMGHGAYRSLDSPPDFWDEDSFEVYYFSSSNSSVDRPDEGEPRDFALFQNYPNPFNSATIIEYRIKSRGHANLKIYNILGKEVVELVNTSQGPGHYVVGWDGTNSQGKDVASGIYFYVLTRGTRKEAKKMLLIR
jgi:hypothetical protein